MNGKGDVGMADQTMTLTLPQETFDRLLERARRHRRPIEDEAAWTLATAVGGEEALPPELKAVISAMLNLDVEALWRISRSQPTVEDGVLLDALVDKRRRDGLTEDEAVLLAELIDRHDRVMLLRAEAVALLRKRGRDVSHVVARA